jgi:hypothetical protein
MDSLFSPHTILQSQFFLICLLWKFAALGPRPCVDTGLAEAVSDLAFSSDNQPSLRSEETNINCPNCFILEEQLQLALQELESAKTIIFLLRDDNISTSVHSLADNPMLSVINAYSHNLVNTNWIPAMHKVNQKKISPYTTAWKVELTTISTNCFSPLDNLKVNQDDDTSTLTSSAGLPNVCTKT